MLDSLALCCPSASSGEILIQSLLRIAVFLLAAIAGVVTGAERHLVPPAIGAKVADVAMKDVSGRRRTLGEFRSQKAIVVVFVGTQCPLANLYLPTWPTCKSGTPSGECKS